MNGYTIATVIQEGRITQETELKVGNIRETIMRQVIDTQDAQIREKLIELGWLPPEQSKTLAQAIQQLRGAYYQGSRQGTVERAKTITEAWAAIDKQIAAIKGGV